jgi:hypothetical protein
MPSNYTTQLIQMPLNGETRYYHSVPTAGGMAEDCHLFYERTDLPSHCPG